MNRHILCVGILMLISLSSLCAQDIQPQDIQPQDVKREMKRVADWQMENFDKIFYLST